MKYKEAFKLSKIKRVKIRGTERKEDRLKNRLKSSAKKRQG